MKQQRPLADLLDQPVQFYGYLDRWEPVPDRQQIRYLFKPSFIKPYGADDSEKRQCHHLWFYFPDDYDRVDRPIRLHRFCAVGSVRRYIRSDGTIDYRVDCTETEHLGRCMSWLHSGDDNPPKQMEVLQEGIDAIDQKVAFFPFATTQEAIDRFRKKLVKKMEQAKIRASNFEASQAIDFSYRVTARMARSKRNSLTPDPVKFKGRSLQSKGFGLQGNTGNTAKHREN